MFSYGINISLLYLLGDERAQKFFICHFKKKLVFGQKPAIKTLDKM